MCQQGLHVFSITLNCRTLSSSLTLGWDMILQMLNWVQQALSCGQWTSGTSGRYQHLGGTYYLCHGNFTNFTRTFMLLFYAHQTTTRLIFTRLLYTDGLSLTLDQNVIFVNAWLSLTDNWSYKHGVELEHKNILQTDSQWNQCIQAD